MLLGIICGCDGIKPDDYEKNKLQPEDYFDFNTMESVEVNIDLGSSCAGALVEFYADKKLGSRPIFKYFTDTQGSIKTSFRRPTYVNEDIFMCYDARPKSTDLTLYKTYLFDDLWPNPDNNDLNDVAIDHESTIHLTSANDVLSIEDIFTVCNAKGSADLEDAFAVIIPASQRGELSLPSGAYDETSTGAIILFKNAQSETGNSFTITRTFSAGELKMGDVETDLDPFIIPMRDNIGYTSGNRREVHLPKHNGTSKIDRKLLGMGEDAYFIYKDGKHPFAIEIPASVLLGEYTLTREKKKIDDAYPRFTQWAEKGKDNPDNEYSDWYLYTPKQ